MNQYGNSSVSHWRLSTPFEDEDFYSFLFLKAVRQAKTAKTGVDDQDTHDVLSRVHTLVLFICSPALS